ncbi:methylenetetrahydrofolate reductase [Tepidibacter hydrothermalis]|uniref:Methylenetetrahydrofolate reductase n=1 Tax=Tepidibacter hydrothermalis TaxID=3036126 RepID=A0ABY8EDE8_9FIRM|nr:methylenetetrahydrofolate reductase [Tepidibacter hydrothermalis]WFD09809.1 methylenetetrahydrofolate reductase [Tepidibacter hydrothermalis]
MKKLREKIKQNQFVTTIEIEPPKSGSSDSEIARIQKLAKLIDGVNIPDNPMANMRMSPISLGSIIQSKLDLEVIFHFACRDRNILSIQSELLGANALGVKNILTLTGDKPDIGDHKDATGVFDIDSIGLTQVVSKLNNGFDFSGNKLEEKTDFFIGGVVNPCSDDLEKELDKFHQKIERGVNFFQTQPVFDIEKLEKFTKKVEHIDIPILYGLMPLKSVKFANYLNKNVPGIDIPQNLIDRLEKGGKQETLNILKETYSNIKGMSKGIHIFPMKDYDLTLELLQG